MTLPKPPEPAMVYIDQYGHSANCYTAEQMEQYKRDTQEACAKLLLNTDLVGIKSNPSLMMVFASVLSEYAKAIRSMV